MKAILNMAEIHLHYFSNSAADRGDVRIHKSDCFGLWNNASFFNGQGQRSNEPLDLKLDTEGMGNRRIKIT